MRTPAGAISRRGDAMPAPTCPSASRRSLSSGAFRLVRRPAIGFDQDAAFPRGGRVAASPAQPLMARGAGEPSTSGGKAATAAATNPSRSPSGSSSSSSAPAAEFLYKRPRKRPLLYMDLPSINWDRWEMLMVRRAQEAGLDDEEGEGEEGEGEVADGGSFAARLADSDLNAAYFQRWDDPAVHQPMLQDRVLTAAWRDALASAPPGALEGRVVLDLGCGLGLLSMLAAKAGAAKVIAVDGSEGAAEAARRIIKANGLQDKITVVHGAIEDLDSLPDVAPGGVDVIVSNWMGAGLLAGGMINSLALAVKKWLRPGGLVLPDRVSLWAAGLEDREALQESKESWSRVAGLDMSAALAEAIKHPRHDVLTRKSQLLSSPQRLAGWDTAALRPEGLMDAESGAYARCPFRFTLVRDERLFGLVVYWEAQWTYGGALEGEGKSPVRFTTHPLSASTHYQQLMVDFPRTMRLQADDDVSGELVLRPDGTDPRDLELELEVEGAGGAPPISATYRVSHWGP